MTVDIKFYFEEIERKLGKDSVGKLCAKLITFMCDHPNDELRMLTFTSIGNILKCDPVSDEVIRAITILVSSKLKVLEKHHLFIDDDDNEYFVNSKDFAEIYQTGVFPHPNTGELVEDWQKKLVPYFTPTKDFLRIKGK